MSYDVRWPFGMRRDWLVYSEVDGQAVCLYARPPRPADQREPAHAVQITRLEWPQHLHRPAEPLHESILNMIGSRMADVGRDAYAHGYLKAQQDIRNAMGLS